MSLYTFYIERTVSIRKRDYFAIEAKSLDEAIEIAENNPSEDETLLEETIENIVNDHPIVYDTKLRIIKEL